MLRVVNHNQRKTRAKERPFHRVTTMPEPSYVEEQNKTVSSDMTVCLVRESRLNRQRTSRAYCLDMQKADLPINQKVIT